MRVSELIDKLKKYQQQYGDVVLYSQKSDGRSSWTSPVILSLKLEQKSWNNKDKVHMLNTDAGY